MIGNGDEYTAGSMIDYGYFKNTYKIIAIYHSRQKVLDADSRAIQQINFKSSMTAEYDIYIVLEETKVLNFTQSTVKVM